MPDDRNAVSPATAEDHLGTLGTVHIIRPTARPLVANLT